MTDISDYDMARKMYEVFRIRVKKTKFENEASVDWDDLEEDHQIKWVAIANVAKQIFDAAKSQ